MEIARQDFEDFRAELRSFKDAVVSGFGTLKQLLGETSARIDQTNVRLDTTSARLEATNAELGGFRKEVTGKLDGISSLLLNSEKARDQVDYRLTSLEQRVDRLEKT